MDIKNVIGYEGIYAVSNDGRVWNLKRGKELKSSVIHGYAYVILQKDGNTEKKRVHRIVYESFKGKIIPNLVIDHIDGNTLNNNVSNLRQITTRDNTSYGWKHHKKSGLPTGVKEFKALKKYGAEITIKGERFYLGSFSTIEEASNAYQQALQSWKDNGTKPIKEDKSIKLCKSCGKTKPVSEFYYIKRHGISWLCKDCMKSEMRKRRIEKKKQV